MKRLLLLLAALSGSPAMADVWPVPNTPDPGRAARSTPVPTLTSATPRSIPWGGGPVRVDSTGTRYTPRDQALGFLPVPSGYRRNGGGLVRIWNGAPTGYAVRGLDTPATLTVLMAAQPSSSTYVTTQPPAPPTPPDPPTPPTPPKPPKPHDPPAPPVPTEDVPGPVGLLAVAAGFHASRRLRQRLG